MSLVNPHTVAPPLPADMEALASREEELLARVKGGDGEAFGELVSPHLGMLYRVAARTTRDSSLAEDAVQETLVIAHRQIGRYQAGTSIRAYLAAIAVRRSLTLVRSEIRRRGREQQSFQPDGGASTEDIVAADQLKERLAAGLARLPAKRREAVIMRLETGLTHSEIAHAMGSTERSVRVLVHLGLKELKKYLEREDEN
jgi:RNA polymerase sigma-70 factor, ECF subfamily